MAAMDARGESARDRAVRRVLAEVDALRAGARVTLVQSGDRPSVLAGPAVLAAEARPALNAWTPEAPHHSLALGIRLARELAGVTGTLIVVSDLMPESRGEAPPSAKATGDRHFERGLWVSVGASLPNVGITAAARTISPDQGRGVVSLTLVNHADAPARRRLSVALTGDGRRKRCSREKWTCRRERHRWRCRFRPACRPCAWRSPTTRCCATTT